MKCDFKADFSVSVTLAQLATNSWGDITATLIMLATRDFLRYNVTWNAASHSLCASDARGARLAALGR
jgi:hypothetical protein